MIKKISSLIALALTLSIAAPRAQASQNDDEWDRLFMSISTVAVTLSPFILTGEVTEATSDVSDHDTNEMPAKTIFVKHAAVEAAEYLAGGEKGPLLNALLNANPERNEDEILDVIFATAEKL